MTWEIPESNGTNASQFEQAAKRMDNYYEDHRKRWTFLVNYIRNVMTGPILSEGLKKSSVTTVYGETMMTLTWKPVYLYEKNDPRWNVDDYLDTEEYETSLQIFVRGVDENYTIQAGFTVHDAKDILISTSDVCATRDAGTIVFPKWWLDSVKNIVTSKPETVGVKKSGILSRFWKK